MARTNYVSERRGRAAGSRSPKRGALILKKLFSYYKLYGRQFPQIGYRAVFSVVAFFPQATMFFPWAAIGFSTSSKISSLLEVSFATVTTCSCSLDFQTIVSISIMIPLNSSK
jgi:hypothetical protein